MSRALIEKHPLQWLHSPSRGISTFVHVCWCFFFLFLFHPVILLFPSPSGAEMLTSYPVDRPRKLYLVFQVVGTPEMLLGPSIYVKINANVMI